MIEVNRPILSTSIFLIALLVVACMPQSIGSSTKGPRTEDLIMRFYSDINAAYDALTTGEVDIVGFSIQEPIYLDAIENPNVVLAPVDDLGMYQFDLNNNYTIPRYPGVRSPTNYKEFRQALAFLVDKDRVVEEFCGGFAARIDQPIAAPTYSWMNASYVGANYPYEYDPTAASALLDSAGFANGTTPNPYYDPAFPGSTTTLRTYPPDHSKAGQDLDNVIFYIRQEDPRRYQAGMHLYENARKIGIPCYRPPLHMIFDEVMGLRDYHVYTGGWSLGRFPTYLYFLYHTTFNIPYGSNYVHGIEADGSPNHPLLDQLVYNVYNAGTWEKALKNTRNALGLFTELCVNIPLFSARSYWAYSSDLLGVVNMQDYFHDNEFMFLNAYKVDSSPIRWGHITPPDDLNIMYYDWSQNFWGASLWRAQCLERIYDWADYDRRPYDIAIDQPGFILDWTVSFWNDSGEERTMLRKEFRSDNYFVEAGSGLQLENVDADTYLFSCYMLYTSDPWPFDLWRPGHMEHVKFFEKISDYEVEVYCNTRRYWEYMTVSPQLLSMSVWLNTSKGLTVHHVDDFLGGVAESFLGLDQPVWVNSIMSNVTGALIEWVDYRWERGDFMLLTDHVGELLTVDYYQLGNFSGYTPGDISWWEVESGCGMYYMTGYSPGAGGNFTARRNPYYYLETPALGEVDFVWEDGGYYEVTIFDIVKAAGAYGSQGIAVPDRNWFPGADIATPGGVIDIFDIVTIASAYGETFGAPPP